MMQRFWLFFYGLPNIIGLGCLLVALLGFIIMLSGWDLPMWGLMIMVALAYPLGWLVGVILQPSNAELQFQNTLTAEEITTQLTRLLRKVKHRVSPEAYQHLQGIEQSILSILPQLVAGRFANHDLFTIKQTVLDYLPTTLENYLKLPPAYAAVHVIQNGKTAKMLLTEQLALIDESTQQVVQNLYHDDAQALLVNERFLQQRLQESRFLP